MLKNANRCCHSHFKFEFSPFASERHAIWGYQKSLITRSSRGQVLCKSTCQQQTISASKFIKKNAVPRIRVESWCRVYRFSKAGFSPRTAFFLTRRTSLSCEASRGSTWRCSFPGQSAEMLPITLVLGGCPVLVFSWNC